MSRIRVLVVDDSAFARKVLREVLALDPEIEVVGYARDGLDALEKISEVQPDVITLDLVMPELDGLGVLRALPKISPPRVLIVSVSGSETELALEALQLGAVDIVTKPTAMATDRLYEISAELAAKVKAVAKARPRLPSEVPEPKVSSPKFKKSADGLLVIGTSTGGPQALSQLFRLLPGIPVPIAVALHIPAGYTAPLAARISLQSEIPLTEAVDGQELEPGKAVLAPGGMHLTIRKSGGHFYAKVSPEPAASLYHPSIDLLFKSAAEAARSGAVGVVLTGMGNDGTEGSLAIARAGGTVLAESASSCVVYGMPRAAIESGSVNAEAPLEKMHSLIAAQFEIL